MPDKRKIKHVCNTLINRPKWWERAILWWVKVERSEDNLHIVFYKYFWNRLYIVGTVCKAPARPKQPPQMQPPKGLMDGFHSPWLN